MRYSVLGAVPGFPFHGIGLRDEMTGVGVETSVSIASVDPFSTASVGSGSAMRG